MEKTRLRLINEQPFYALFLNKIKVVWLDSVKTAGVRINQRGEIEMAINRQFIESRTIPQQVGVLIHEMLHVMFDHIGHRGLDLDHEIAGIAMDVAINQMIDPHLKEDWWLSPEMYGLPKDLAFEPYYLALLEKEQKNPGSVKGTTSASEGQGGGKPQKGNGQPNGGGNGKGSKTLDNHDFFENQAVGGVDVQKIIADAIDGALKECKNRFPGKEPLAVERLLSDLREKCKVNWKDELRKFVGRNLSDHASSTRTRANRRLGLAAMGVKRDYVPKVLILCDHSGSVSDEMAVELIHEMRGILKATGEKTQVAFFDTEMGTKCKLSKFSEIPPRTKQGGTSFHAAFEYAKEYKPDLLIMLTDAGDAMPEQPKFPTMWVVVGGYPTEHLKGKVVTI